MENIPIDLLLTAQEHLIIGSTPTVQPTNTEDWYKPQGLLTDSRYSIEDLVRKRKGLRILKSEIVGSALKKNSTVVIGLEDLDPETNQTMQDPKILGLWDDKKNKIINEAEGPGLTARVYRLIERSGLDLHLRLSSQEKELESSGGSEIK